MSNNGKFTQRDMNTRINRNRKKGRDQVVGGGNSVTVQKN